MIRSNIGYGNGDYEDKIISAFLNVVEGLEDLYIAASSLPTRFVYGAPW